MAPSYSPIDRVLLMWLKGFGKCEEVEERRVEVDLGLEVVLCTPSAGQGSGLGSARVASAKLDGGTMRCRARSLEM
jgi:hypothetical protein